VPRLRLTNVVSAVGMENPTSECRVIVEQATISLKGADCLFVD
jgi:hypothetical protein